MRLTITIDLDNAAFYESECGPGLEIARILREYSKRAEDETIEAGRSVSLWDYNGNRVGQAKITKGRR